MIHGTGIDILHIKRIQTLYENNPDDPFFQKVFTQKERQFILRQPAPYWAYATRFAGKEAVFKALQIHPDSIQMNDIEILTDEKGIPSVTLHGNALQLANQFQIHRIHISLSYDTDYAIAYAICETV